jgi:hypothetical protein
MYLVRPWSGNYRKWLKALEAKSVQEGVVLTEDQIVALEGPEKTNKPMAK